MIGTRLVPPLTAALLLVGPSVFSTAAEDAAEDTARDADPRRAIALIDLSYVYANYPSFKERIAELKLEVDRAQGEVQAKQKAVEEMTRRLQLSTVGTPEHAELEKKITLAQAELAGSVQAQKKTFLRAEARIYHDAYEEIAREVEEHAKENGIAVVLRFNDDPVNVANPEEVLKRINRELVWCDKRRDVTRTIVQRLVKRSKASEPLPQETEQADEAEEE